MSTHYPEIRIKYGWLLANATAEPMNKFYAPEKKTRSPEYYEEIAQKYRDFWQPYEKRVLKAMYDVTGLQFRAEAIDAYVVPWFYAFSDPLVIGVVFDTQEKLVATLTHELSHRLFMDSRTHDDTNTIEEWTELFGKRNFVALVHIPVYAVMCAVFKDELKEPKILDEEVHTAKEYQEAWSYVEKHGHEAIIAQLKKLYAPK